MERIIKACESTRACLQFIQTVCLLMSQPGGLPQPVERYRTAMSVLVREMKTRRRILQAELGSEADWINGADYRADEGLDLHNRFVNALEWHYEQYIDPLNDATAQELCEDIDLEIAHLNNQLEAVTK